MIDEVVLGFIVSVLELLALAFALMVIGNDSVYIAFVNINVTGPLKQAEL